MGLHKKHTPEYFSREKWLYYTIALVFSLVFGRLVWLQVIQAPTLNAKGIERRTSEQNIIPQRGIIYDAEGHVLAQSIPVKQVYADPNMLDTLIAKHQLNSSKDEIAAKIASVLGVSKQDILNKLNQKAEWVSLAHQVDIPKAQEIMSWKIPGVGLSDEEKRIYPMDQFASSALGFVNLAGHGVEGIEAYYDKLLFGKTGFETEQVDTSQHSILDTLQQSEPAQPGDNLTLTINPTIQFLVDQQLDKLMQTSKAKDAVILAMDPQTGRILGIGSRPTFDPNHYVDSPPADWVNRAISMTYEPGSTFKIITGSAAIEEGAITPDERFPDPGYIRVGSHTITNWDPGPHGDPTFTQGMELSSNVVLSQVGLKLGKDKFYTYLKAFGFGAKTGVDIGGEESGLIYPKDKVGNIELATMSFGQTNLVTPIQLLTAISAVANGGTLYKPYIVDKITTPDGKLVQQNKPTPVRQVISKATANQMTQVLEQVVQNGTGYKAQIPGINVAGKTGTAQKVDPKTGQYSSKDFIASFAAYAPAENPKIAVLVIADSPQGDHDGGVICAPRAKPILEGALQYYGIPVAQDTQTTVSLSTSNSSVRPTPKPVTPERTPGPGEAVVPDLTGLTMRQVGETLAKQELHFNFTGSGLANGQTPSPGKVVPKGTIINIKFQPLGQSP